MCHEGFLAVTIFLLDILNALYKLVFRDSLFVLLKAYRLSVGVADVIPKGFRVTLCDQTLTPLYLCTEGRITKQTNLVFGWTAM